MFYYSIDSIVFLQWKTLNRTIKPADISLIKVTNVNTGTICLKLTIIRFFGDAPQWKQTLLQRLLKNCSLLWKQAKLLLSIDKKWQKKL